MNEGSSAWARKMHNQKRDLLDQIDKLTKTQTEMSRQFVETSEENMEAPDVNFYPEGLDNDEKESKLRNIQVLIDEGNDKVEAVTLALRKVVEDGEAVKLDDETKLIASLWEAYKDMMLVARMMYPKYADVKSFQSKIDLFYREAVARNASSRSVYLTVVRDHLAPSLSYVYHNFGVGLGWFCTQVIFTLLYYRALIDLSFYFDRLPNMEIK